MRYEIIHVSFTPARKLPPLQNELVMHSRRGTTVFALDVDHDSPVKVEIGLIGVRHVHLRLNLRRLTASQGKFWKVLRYAEFILRAFFQVLFRRSRIIVAHDLTSLIPAFAASRLTGRRLVYHAHEIMGEMDEVAAPFQSLWRNLDRFFCPKVDSIVTPEPHRAQIYMTDYGAKKLPVVVANCPLYRPSVRSNLLRDYVVARNSSIERIILYQGIIEPDRCIDNIIHAMSMVPARFAFILMGTGHKGYFDKLTGAIETLSLTDRIFFHPYVPYDRLHAYTSSADIGVLLYRNTNRNNYYCAPNKLYEYFQAGLPVIASDFPGMHAIVGQRRLGFCVDPEDPASIAYAMIKLLDSEVRNEIIERIESLREREFQYEKEFENLSPLYTSLMKDEK